jgi:hypothetical protein
MSIEEKAKELVLEFYPSLASKLPDEYDTSAWQISKDFALKTAEKIKQELLENLSNDVSAIHAIYWEKVKEEIKSL